VLLPTLSVGSSTAPQRDAYAQAREWMDKATDLVRPGVGTDVIAKSWPAATEFGFANEMAAFGLQFGHGLGLGLHERPVISRLNSLVDPIELQAGMVFALETYCPASDGVSAARIEEEIVVTDNGPAILTHFPAQELYDCQRVLGERHGHHHCCFGTHQTSNEVGHVPQPSRPAPVRDARLRHVLGESGQGTSHLSLGQEPSRSGSRPR